MAEALLAVVAAGLACGVAVVPLLVIVGVVAYRVRSARQRSIEVAPSGFQPGPHQKQVQWWVGVVDGRAAGLVPVIQRTSAGPGQGAGAGRMGLRLVLTVSRPALGWVVAHPWGRSPTDTFERAFGADHPESVQPEVRSALLGFVQTFGGGLRLRDRAGANTGFLPAAVLPHAEVVLGHEFTGDINDAEEVLRRFEALARVAEVVERV